jgi:hypothetical protein
MTTVHVSDDPFIQSQFQIEEENMINHPIISPGRPVNADPHQPISSRTEQYMPPAMSSTQQEEARDSASETDHQAVAREAAIRVQENFEASSELRDVNREAAIALYNPEEVLIKDTICSGFFCTVSGLRGISLRPSNFKDSIEEHRDRFAGRSHDGGYALKYISPESVKQDEETARIAGATLMIEAKMLMNLAPHPHICQLYGLNASGINTTFGSKISEDGFFLIIDSISETLPQRMAAWREKKGYHEGERFDDLKTRQSQLTQRLEVALDICSPMVFLSKRKIVYCLHPEKCGFDSKYKRIKLFHFGQARESGKEPYSTFIDEDMRYRAYLAPEIFKEETAVTCDADVYAFGMLLWEILTLKHPLEGMSNVSHITQVVTGRARPSINKTWPESIRKLIESCWTATDRPTMKEVYDRLENVLLFQQDFEGIDRTEDHNGMAPQAKSTRRRIKYEGTNETITEEDRDKDSKSVRSRESVRSRDTKVSVRSNRSPGSAKSKTERRPRRKSADQVSTEEGANQVNQEDNNTQRPSRRSDVERPRYVEKDGSQRQRSSRQLSRDRVEKPEDDEGEPSLPKVAAAGPDEKPVEDAAEPRSPSRLKDKNGKIRRRRSSSAEDVIGTPNDDDDQSSGPRSTSSRLSSGKDKDGKIRRTAVKPDTSNDDNESTARKSVGSNESLSQRRRPSRRVSKINLNDTLEGLGKDEDVPTPETCSWTVGNEEVDGPVGVRRTKSGSSQTDESTDGPDTSNLRRGGRRPNKTESNGTDEGGGRVLRRGVARSKSSDDGFLSRQASSRRAAGSENNQTEESGGRRRGAARSKSAEESLHRQSSSRKVTSAENNNNDNAESGGRVAAALSRRNLLARSKASDDGAPNHSPAQGRRPLSRRKSGDNALTLMTATASRAAPATRGIARHRSVSTTTYPASGHPASSVREAPSAQPRRVVSVSSPGNELRGITAWLAATPIEESKSQGGFTDFGGSSPDLGFVIERQNKNTTTSQEKTFSLSMSDHSNWFDLSGADKKQDEKDQAVVNPFGNKTEKLRSSDNDTKGAIRKRIIEKAKEMAKEKKERIRAAHGLPISEDFQRRRVGVQVAASVAAVRGPSLLSRQKSKRQVKRVSSNDELTSVAKLLSLEHQ